MLKWVVLAIVIVVAGLVGLRKYSLDHATEEGSFSAKLYERRIEGQLLDHCRALIKEHPRENGENTPQQNEAFCKCFANDMFDRLREVPPDELQAHLEKAATKTSMQDIIKKCGYAAGLD
jgi:hypothetical protein